MAEYIIAENEYRVAMRKAYEAGAAGREVYTARDCLTRELVRCRDCDKRGSCIIFAALAIKWPCQASDGSGYCAWGKRREDA